MREWRKELRSMAKVQRGGSSERWRGRGEDWSEGDEGNIIQLLVTVVQFIEVDSCL